MMQLATDAGPSPQVQGAQTATHVAEHNGGTIPAGAGSALRDLRMSSFLPRARGGWPPVVGQGLGEQRLFRETARLALNTSSTSPPTESAAVRRWAPAPAWNLPAKCGGMESSSRRIVGGDQWG